MQIKDAAAWQKRVAANQDPYGKIAIEYAERWANLMEQRMAEGNDLDSIADNASREADTVGITGFIYGAAVQALATSWEHGEQLRRWHNLKTQIHNEGERANESGGALNPAVLNILLN